MASCPITLWQIDGEPMETVTDSIFFFFWSPKLLGMVCSQEIKRHLLLGRKAITLGQRIKKQRHYFAHRGPYCQSYGFSGSHVRVWM